MQVYVTHDLLRIWFIMESPRNTNLRPLAIEGGAAMKLLSPTVALLSTDKASFRNLAGK
jgi:hypothetical protein